MEAVAVSFSPEVLCVKPFDVCLEIQKVLNERFQNTPGKKVIALGLKNEPLMSFLYDKFGEKVSCMDPEDWNERNRKIKAKTVQGVFLSLPIADNSVDVMVSTNVFEEELDLVRTIAEIERVLASGGEALFIISDKYFENGKMKLDTALDIVESSMVASPAEGGDSRVVIFKKK